MDHKDDYNETVTGKEVYSEELVDNEVNKKEVDDEKVNSEEVDKVELYNDELHPENSSKEMSGKKILSYCGLYLSLMTLAILAAQIIISLIIGTISEILSYDLKGSGWFTVVLTAIGMVAIGLPVFARLMKRIPDSERGEVRNLSLGQFFGFFIICVGAAYISNIIGMFISFFIETINGIKIINPLEDFIFNNDMILIMIYASIIAPIVEELIFRKILLDKLRRFGDLPAILISGIAFGLFHMNLSQFFYATVLGILLAYITIRTNRIIYSILLHMMLNFIGSGIVPLLSANENVLGVSIIAIWFLATMTIGSILMIVNSRKVVLNKPKEPLVKKTDYILNPGAIIFGLICIVMIVVESIG